ncbi:hypothetical protein FACS1894195_5270 [Bacteroidia bacterium]|nr:hypothetical protein FACS1894195_5270 [Bacteroidia bacterium]
MTSGTGTAMVTVEQVGNDNYNAYSYTKGINSKKADQTITWRQTLRNTYGDTTRLRATTSSKLPVVFTSDNPSVAQIVRDTLLVIRSGTGTAKITATQAGDNNYNPVTGKTGTNSVSGMKTITAAKIAQTITWEQRLKSTYGDTTLLRASVNSGLPIKFTSSHPTIAQVVKTKRGDVLTIKSGTGTAHIEASQSGNRNYGAAGEVTYSVTAAKKHQSIYFINPSPATMLYSDTLSFINTAQGGKSGSPIYYLITDSVGTTEIDELTGRLTRISAGTINVEAIKEADEDYYEATANYSLTVEKIDQAFLTFEVPIPDVQTHSDTFRFINKARGGNGTGDITYTIIGGTSKAVIDTLTGEISNATVGTVRVCAVKAEDMNYYATEATYTLIIAKSSTDTTDVRRNDLLKISNPSAIETLSSPTLPTLHTLEVREREQAIALLQQPMQESVLGFAFNKTELGASAQDVLDNKIHLLQANPDLNIRIEGHTCNIGTLKSNLLVSKLRAEAVSNYLISKGLAPERIVKIEGKAQLAPLVPNTNDANRQINRRVVILVE